MSNNKGCLSIILFIFVVLFIFCFFVNLIIHLPQANLCKTCKIVTNKERVITDGNFNNPARDYCIFAFSDNTSKIVSFGEYSNFNATDTFCFKQYSNKPCK